MAKQKKPVEKTEVMVLDRYEQNTAQLQEIANSYTNIVVNEETFKDALKARQTLRETRFAIQAQRDKNDAMRIAWNKKAMNDNKSLSDELISIILPVEETIDAQIKMIEKKKESEKLEKERIERERFEGRKQQLADTGATITIDGFLLNDQFISNQEVLELPESTFDRVVSLFVETSEKLKALALEEEKRLAAIEEEKRIHAERISKMKQQLFELGMVHNGTGFMHPIAQGTVQPISDQLIDVIDDEGFNSIVNTLKDCIADQKRIDDEAKMERERIQKENERIAAEQEQRRLDMEREREQLEKEKAAVRNERIITRKKSLFNLGMGAMGTGFVFNGTEMFSEITLEQIETLNEEEWTKEVEIVSNEIAKIKAEEDRIRIEKIEADKQQAEADRKAKELAEQKAKERAEALRPDREKLIEWVDMAAMPTVNLQTNEATECATLIATKFLLFKSEMLQIIDGL